MKTSAGEQARICQIDTSGNIRTLAGHDDNVITEHKEENKNKNKKAKAKQL